VLYYEVYSKNKEKLTDIFESLYSETLLYLDEEKKINQDKKEIRKSWLFRKSVGDLKEKTSKRKSLFSFGKKEKKEEDIKTTYRNTKINSDFQFDNLKDQLDHMKN
jgi:hypothetical protein